MSGSVATTKTVPSEPWRTCPLLPPVGAGITIQRGCSDGAGVKGRYACLKDSVNLKNRVVMNLAKLSANGQITVPVEVRRRLHLVPGDKVLFVEKANGEVVVAKAGLAALSQAQAAFSNAAADFGVSDDTEVQSLVDDVRGRVS